MSDPIIENAEDEPPRDDIENGESSAPEDPLQQVKDRASDVLRNGASDVRERIEAQIPNIQADLARGMGEASYGIGYALKFATTLLKEFAPEDVNSGYEKGADAGGKAAEVVVKDRQDRQTNPATEGPDDPELTPS